MNGPAETILAAFDKLALDLETDVLRGAPALAAFSSAVQEGFADSDEVLDPEVVLGRISDGTGRRTAASCLLRVLAAPGTEFLHDPPWRQSILTVIEAGIDVEGTWAEIARETQSHLRIARIAAASSAAIRDFHGAVNKLISLDTMGSHRQSLLKSLRSARGRNVVAPFVGDTAIANLSEFYARCQRFVEIRKDPGVADEFKTLNEIADQTQDALARCQTSIAETIRTAVVSKLRDLARQDLERNSAVKPAALRVEIGEKQYPLHEPNAELHLILLLRNPSQGVAYNVRVVLAPDAALAIVDGEFEVGRIGAGETRPLEVPFRVVSRTDKAQCLAEVKWEDYDGQTRQRADEILIPGQRTGIDWSILSRREAYSLEPAFSESDLVGRRELLNRLVALTGSSPVGSAIVSGQKRVGKTSVVRALESQLSDSNCCVIYLEGGDYVCPSPEETVAMLGRRICGRLQRLDPRWRGIALPEFRDSLAPVVEFLVELRLLAPDRQIVFILDEFDELPFALYQKTSVGEAFFLSLRSIASKSGIGCVLVGGEKMRFVLNRQGAKLNKWLTLSVDYFQRDSEWEDFRELVERPVAGILDFSPSAIAQLYRFSAGNPYFTKLICQYVFRRAVNNRDSHITDAEIESAVGSCVREVQQNTFQHFWDDGIEAEGIDAEAESVRRRRVLVAVADALAHSRSVRREVILAEPLLNGVADVSGVLNEFIGRGILKSTGSEQSGDVIDIAVPLFLSWLQGRGAAEVMASFAASDAAARRWAEQERLRVTATEVVELVNRWPSYRGSRMGADNVRAWLDQFESVKEQRAVFAFLQRMMFVSDGTLRSRMAEIHQWIRDSLIGYSAPPEGFTKGDMVISYLDGPAKSGPQMARMFADSAKVPRESVVERSALASHLKTTPEARVLVVLDDCVGTGSTVAQGLRDLEASVGAEIRARGIRVALAVMVASNQGIETMTRVAEEMRMGIEARVLWVFDWSQLNLTDSARSIEGDYVLSVLRRYGERIAPEHSLGFGGLAMPVVFERGCPNNAPSVLWKVGSRWLPLFPRY